MDFSIATERKYSFYVYFAHFPKQRHCETIPYFLKKLHRKNPNMKDGL